MRFWKAGRLNCVRTSCADLSHQAILKDFVGLRTHYLTLASERHLYEASGYRAMVKSIFGRIVRGDSLELVVT